MCDARGRLCRRTPRQHPSTSRIKNKGGQSILTTEPRAQMCRGAPPTEQRNKQDTKNNNSKPVDRPGLATADFGVRHTPAATYVVIMSAHHLLCSRENSRQARNIITKVSTLKSHCIISTQLQVHRAVRQSSACPRCCFANVISIAAAVSRILFFYIFASRVLRLQQYAAV